MGGERYTFIKLTRSLVYSDSFMSEKMLKVWIWCLIKANYEAKNVPVKVGSGQRLVPVKRGQFIFGRWTASEELNMAGSTVTSIMKKLQQMGNISIAPDNQFSIVTVSKYDLYQGSELYGSTTNEQPTDTTKKEKKEKKHNNIEERKKKFTEEVESFGDSYNSNMLGDFIRHWTEENKAGTKMKFEMQSTWSMKGRLTTWKKNAEKWNPKNVGDSTDGNEKKYKSL